MMKRAFLMVLGLALTSLLTAAPANAAFVLIDNFKPGGVTDTAAVRGGTASSFASPGVATFTAGDTLSYTNLASIVDPPSGLAGNANTTIRINGVNASVTPINIFATANGGAFAAANVPTVPGSNGFLDFVFTGLNPDNLTDLNFNVFAGTFTANGIYAIPEPATMSLIGLACCGGLVGFRRRRTAVVA